MRTSTRTESRTLGTRARLTEWLARLVSLRHSSVHPRSAPAAQATTLTLSVVVDAHVVLEERPGVGLRLDGEDEPVRPALRGEVRRGVAVVGPHVDHDVPRLGERFQVRRLVGPADPRLEDVAVVAGVLLQDRQLRAPVGGDLHRRAAPLVLARRHVSPSPAGPSRPSVDPLRSTNKAPWERRLPASGARSRRGRRRGFVDPGGGGGLHGALPRAGHGGEREPRVLGAGGRRARPRRRRTAGDRVGRRAAVRGRRCRGRDGRRAVRQVGRRPGAPEHHRGPGGRRRGRTVRGRVRPPRHVLCGIERPGRTRAGRRHGFGRDPGARRRGRGRVRRERVAARRRGLRLLDRPPRRARRGRGPRRSRSVDRADAARAGPARHRRRPTSRDARP